MSIEICCIGEDGEVSHLPLDQYTTLLNQRNCHALAGKSLRCVSIYLDPDEPPMFEHFFNIEVDEEGKWTRDSRERMLKAGIEADREYQATGDPLGMRSNPAVTWQPTPEERRELIAWARAYCAHQRDPV